MVFPGERNLRCPGNGNQSGDSRSRFRAAKSLTVMLGAIDLQITRGLKPSNFLETNSRTVPNSPRDLAVFHLNDLTGGF